MSFFDIDMPKGGTFETGGGDIELIPAKTQVLAAPDEVKWDSFNDEPEYISIRWVVLAPKEYKNRKIFQKLKVKDSDQKRSEKAKRMLAAIDQNAGGNIVLAGVEPNDASLTKHLVNCQMVLMLQIWKMEIEGQEKSGNWVSAVSPKKGGKVTESKPASQPLQSADVPEQVVEDITDDDVPF